MTNRVLSRHTAAVEEVAMRLRWSKGDADVTRFLKRYRTHPSADVASAPRQRYSRRPPVADRCAQRVTERSALTP